MFQKMGVPFRQMHSWDYSGPYHGYDGFAIFARDMDMAINSPIWKPRRRPGRRLERPPAEPPGVHHEHAQTAEIIDHENALPRARVQEMFANKKTAFGSTIPSDEDRAQIEWTKTGIQGRRTSPARR